MMDEVTMVRTQIQLTEGQLRLLKRLATERGVSVATLIRESVDRFVRAAGPVDDQEQRRRALATAGRFHSGRPDLAAEHDRYLEYAYRQ
jgi:16S rRNA U516 pseudouridylate synthase RsuA-like enzyme